MNVSLVNDHWDNASTVSIRILKILYRTVGLLKAKFNRRTPKLNNVLLFIIISGENNALELKSLDVEQPTKPVVGQSIFSF